MTKTIEELANKYAANWEVTHNIHNPELYDLIVETYKASAERIMSLPLASRLTALAREYAEEMCAHMMDDFIKDEAIRDNELAFMIAVEHISRRFCFVEKRIILDEYKDVVENIEEATAREGFINLEDKGKKDFIESLFPEIAKEVE